jgi:hypothetical protein
MGGRVDVFKPYFIKRSLIQFNQFKHKSYLNLYDVNSLYVCHDILHAMRASFFFKGHQKIYDALFQSKQLGFIEL